MLRKSVMLLLLCLIASSTIVVAQGSLNGAPYDPETEPLIDMFISSWKESMPRNTHGSLIERDIFLPLKGSDPVRPEVKGAVLTNLQRFSYGTLTSNQVTIPTTLTDNQEIFYVSSGKGIVKTKYQAIDLYKGIGVLIPPGIEFVMTNTGTEPLNMYIFRENLPNGFVPKKEIVVKDENVEPFSSSSVHWVHCYKGIFGRADGLATLAGMGPVWFNPMTMGQPHSHAGGVEEIWFALEGDITVLLGKQLRKLPAGSAYKIPPNNLTPHANINVTGEALKLFWFMN